MRPYEQDQGYPLAITAKTSTRKYPSTPCTMTAIQLLRYRRAGQTIARFLIAARARAGR